MCLSYDIVSDMKMESNDRCVPDEIFDLSNLVNSLMIAIMNRLIAESKRAQKQ